MNVRAILQRLRIDVLYENGVHLEALCPAHEDTKPSWRIRIGGERAGLHHCQSCKFGGDITDLVQLVRGYMTKGAAYEWLEEHGDKVERADLDVPALELVMGGEVQRAPFKMPRGFEFGPLATWPTIAREFALRRGLTPEQIARWGVGYAAEGKLHDRLVIPVVSRAGRLAGYMARSWDPDARRKYLYPSEEEHADLQADLDVVFGEVHWRKATTCVLTEGALKSFAVERAFDGLSHAALGGSHVRPMQVTALATFGFARVVVMTDNDPAGKAAGDAYERQLGRYVETRRCLPPPEEDADSMPRAQLLDVLGPYVSR